MPESSPVYQPTTVGFPYENPRFTNRLTRLRSGFSNIVSQNKLTSRRWFEWVLLSAAFCIFVAGLTVMIVKLLSYEDLPRKISQDTNTETTLNKDAAAELEGHLESGSSGSLALGATMMLLGLLLGLVWVWLRFFQRSKSPRGGLTGGGGQILGGLNPSTDLLVGTSQYGPVLTELPSQMKPKSSETPVTLPLSDHEEETHTLMQESSSPPNTSNTPSIITSQIPG